MEIYLDHIGSNSIRFKLISISHAMKPVDVVEVEGKGKFWKELGKKPQLLDVVIQGKIQGSFKLKIKRRTKTITEGTLSPIVPLSLCQVSHHPPPFKNPGSATVIDTKSNCYVQYGTK